MLRIWWLDPIAEASQLADYSGRAPLLGFLSLGRAPFFVTDSLVQDQPDEPTLSMGNRADSLVVSKTRYHTTIDHLEDCSFCLGRGVRRLIENASHMAVALWRAMVVVHSGALVVTGAGTHPGGETSLGGKGLCGGTDFSNDLLR